MSAGVLARNILGETLLLHPERALSWPARSMLIVADTHFGKSSLLGRHGIAVPGGADSLDRTRLDSLLQATGSGRLLILGDFLHGPMAPDGAAAAALQRWIAALHPVRLLLVTGNHDRSAASGWRATAAWEGDLLREGPFLFTHDVDAGHGREAAAYRIGGHVHPVAVVGGRSKLRLRVPVFWERPDALVLPSFGLFTGGYRVRRNAGRLFVADAGQVVELAR